MVISQPKPRISLGSKVLLVIIWFLFSVGIFNLIKRRKILNESHSFSSWSRHRSTITNPTTNRGGISDTLAVSNVLRRRQYGQIPGTNAAIAALSYALGSFFPEKPYSSFFFHGVTFSRTITQTGK